MVNNKIAQRAVAAGLSGLMAFGAAAPAALAYSPQNFNWYKTNSNDDGVYWKRLSGDDRYGTMKEIVKAYNEFERVTGISIYGTKTESDYNYHATAVIASGDNFPDALAANGLAGYLTNMNLTVNGGTNGAVPVILTKSGKLSNEAKDLLKYMQVQEAIVMGGTAAISQDVEDAIAKMGIRVSRVAGKDRQETSLKALQAINGNWKGRKGTWDLIIATGDNYADALSISPYAYRMGTPIVLTKKDGTLTDAQVEAIRSNDDIREILIVGGTSAVSDQVMGQIGTINKNKVGVQYHRIAGVDRYDTSAKIARWEVEAWSTLWNGIAGFSFDHAIVATGENFPDALAGGQLAGGIGDLLADRTVYGDKAVDVKDFSGINEWSPSPLLLVKDDSLYAESVIGWGIGRDRVTSNTATYASWATWQNTVNGWYGNSTVEYNTLWRNWYDACGALYISDRAIESVKNNGQLNGNDAYAKNDETVTYTLNGALAVTGVSVTNNRNGRTYDLTNRAAMGNTAEGYTVVGGTIDYWYTDAETGIRYQRLASAGQVDVDGNALGCTPTETIAGTYSQQFVIYDAITWNASTTGRNTAGTALATPTWGAWTTEVIGMVDWDEDFYGIILGGTAAVSNKKRDDLDDIVRDTVRDANVVTVGGEVPNTVTVFSEDFGINLNYSRLIPVATAKPNKIAFNNGTNYPANTLRADVYRVSGTDSYVLVVFDTNGNLIDWVYYLMGATAGNYQNIWA